MARLREPRLGMWIQDRIRKRGLSTKRGSFSRAVSASSR